MQNGNLTKNTIKMKAEEIELKKEVQYWAGRLIGHEQNYDIAEEIIQFAEDYAKVEKKMIQAYVEFCLGCYNNDMQLIEYDDFVKLFNKDES